MNLSPQVAATLEEWLASSTWHTPQPGDEVRFNRLVKALWERGTPHDESVIGDMMIERLRQRGELTAFTQDAIQRRADSLRMLLAFLRQKPVPMTPICFPANRMGVSG